MAAQDAAYPTEARKTIPDENLQKINILLREYDTLRTEILQRTAAGFAVPAVVVAIAGWLLSPFFEHHPYIAGALALVVVAGLALGARFMNVQIRWCAARVTRIENRINFLAQDHLLEWESRWGIGATGHHMFKEDFPPDAHADQRVLATGSGK